MGLGALQRAPEVTLSHCCQSYLPLKKVLRKVNLIHVTYSVLAEEMGSTVTKTVREVFRVHLIVNNRSNPE